MINSVTIAGYLGQDPEVKVVGADNIAVTTISVAVQSGKDKTIWVKVTAWRATAEFIGTYLKKGSFVVVQGRLEQETWTDEDNKNHSVLKVTAENVQSPKTK